MRNKNLKEIIGSNRIWNKKGIRKKKAEKYIYTKYITVYIWTKKYPYIWIKSVNYWSKLHKSLRVYFYRSFFVSYLNLKKIVRQKSLVCKIKLPNISQVFFRLFRITKTKYHLQLTLYISSNSIILAVTFHTLFVLRILNAY